MTAARRARDLRDFSKGQHMDSLRGSRSEDGIGRRHHMHERATCHLPTGGQISTCLALLSEVFSLVTVDPPQYLARHRAR